MLDSCSNVCRSADREHGLWKEHICGVCTKTELPIAIVPHAKNLLVALQHDVMISLAAQSFGSNRTCAKKHQHDARTPHFARHQRGLDCDLHILSDVDFAKA